MSHIRVNTSNAKVRHRMEKRERERGKLSGVVRNYPCPVISEIHGIPSKPPFRGPFKTNFFKGSL